MLYKKILALDHNLLDNHFAVLENGQVLKTIQLNRFTLTKTGLNRLQKHFAPDLLLITGPDTEYFPEQVGDTQIKKEKRLQALLNGVHFLTPASPSLSIVFEVGCHIFYRSEETVYVGCLPYSYGSKTLKKDLSIEAEMGHAVGKPLDVCVTAGLHGFPHIKSEETLLSYTISLGLKEFLARYTLTHCYIGGDIQPHQFAQLQEFLPNITLKMLDNPTHIAAFGLLLPYIAPDL